jgi:hypothetical protein
MPTVPTDALPLLVEFAPAFTRPAFPRFLTLLLAAILCIGRRWSPATAPATSGSRP